jgi:hypothetical protein
MRQSDNEIEPCLDSGMDTRVKPAYDGSKQCIVQPILTKPNQVLHERPALHPPDAAL